MFSAFANLFHQPNQPVYEEQDELYLSGRVLMVQDIKSWARKVVHGYPDVQVVVYRLFNNYSAVAVPVSLENTKARRMKFNERWHGLSGDTLRHATGIETANFCSEDGKTLNCGSLSDLLILVDASLRQ